MADWQNLPDDLLITIATILLTNLSANIRFAGACRSWRRVALQDRHRLTGRQQIPGLILPTPGCQDPSCKHRKFIRVTDIINHHRQNNNNDNNNGGNLRTLTIPWRLAERSLCLGWFRGWMLVLDYDSNLTLQNPVTGSEFALPDASGLKKTSIKHLEFLLWGFRRSRRVTIWAPPCGHSVSVSDWYVFVVLPMENSMLYCRVGDAEWRIVEFPEYQLGKEFIVDALCCSNSSLEEGFQIYVLISTGELFCCDVSEEKRIVAFGDRVRDRNWWKVLSSLVEVEGEILLVHVNRNVYGMNFYSRASGFNVYRLDRKRKQWVEITELGEFAVFIGFGQPFSVPAAELELGIRANCIYFLEMEETRSDRKVWCNIGVFDLKTSTIDFFHVDSEPEIPRVGKPVRLPVPIAPVPW